jgi:hypothetical protein
MAGQKIRPDSDQGGDEDHQRDLGDRLFHRPNGYRQIFSIHFSIFRKPKLPETKRQIE